MPNFFDYLLAKKLSSKSLKNYKSDVSHFTGWAMLKLKSFGTYVENLEDIFPFIDHSFIYEYKSYMLENSTPAKSINRRLSTLRHLSSFLTSLQLVESDFMNGIENISTTKKSKAQWHTLIRDFEGSLEAQKISNNTIKNYLSDVRQFLNWLEKNIYAQTS